MKLLQRESHAVAMEIGFALGVRSSKKQIQVEDATALGMQWIRSNGVGHIGPATRDNERRCADAIKVEMLGGLAILWPLFWPLLSALIAAVVKKLIEMWKDDE